MCKGDEEVAVWEPLHDEMAECVLNKLRIQSVNGKRWVWKENM